MVLKPQDVYVALKIVAAKSIRAPYSQLAVELAMSPSEVHASVQRAEKSHLLHGPRLRNRPNFSALEEFLLHGIKYIFRPNGEGSPAESRHRMPPRLCAELSRKGTSPFLYGRMRKASGGASRLSRCIRPPLSRPCTTRLFTSI